MPPFYRPINQASVVLASDHTSGDGQLVVVDATVLGSPSASSPVKLSSGPCIFSVTGVTGNTLTVSGMLEGSSDQDLAAGARAEVRLTAKDLSDIHAAISRPFVFRAVGGPIATGQQPQSVYVDQDCVASTLDVTASAGTVTAQVEKSTDGGTSWSAVDSISLASGLSASKSSSGSIAAGTLLRVNYTATSSCSDPVVTLIAVHA